MRKIALALAVVGTVVIWMSPSVGESMARTQFRDSGGYIGYNINPEKRDAHTMNVRLIGAIMLGVGLFRGIRPGKESQV